MLAGGAVDQYAIKAAGPFAMALQPVSCRQHQACLLCGGDAGRGTAIVGTAAAPDFDEHGAAAVVADEIDLAAAHPEVAFDDAQAPSLQVVGGEGFAGLAFGPARVHARMPDMENALYVVATPIGNLGDITLRALEALRGADLVACEDTRHARHLLDHHGIRVQTLALHQHNEQESASRLVAELAAGRRVALISDAGTPGVSDPGARAVAAARAAGYRVIPLPGPNAAVTAISAAGLSDARFHFVGFLPTKVGARRTAIEALAQIDAMLVFHEAPHRVQETVADLAQLLRGGRTLVIARELTKVFEQIAAMPLADAGDWLAADPNRLRGEFVLLVSAPPPQEGLDAESERVLRVLLAELPLRQAAKLAAQITGQPKNLLYERALALKDDTGPPV